MIPREDLHLDLRMLGQPILSRSSKLLLCSFLMDASKFRTSNHSKDIQVDREIALNHENQLVDMDTINCSHTDILRGSIHSLQGQIAIDDIVGIEPVVHFFGREIRFHLWSYNVKNGKVQ